MKKEAIISGALLFISGGVLLWRAPDMLSRSIGLTMCIFMAIGYALAIVPCARYCGGFRYATAFIQKMRRTQSANMWVAVSRAEVFFMNETLDSLFADYKEKIKKRSGDASRSLYDIEDVINESVLSMKTWQRVTSQIPNMLTALGILGTFIGLIQGVSGIKFSSVEVAVGSVQNLLAGVSTAFYTSICGVILSILYTFVSRTLWNIMLQNMDRFYRDFHMYVSDTADVRDKLLRNASLKEILSHLDTMISLQRAEEYEDETDQ